MDATYPASGNKVSTPRWYEDVGEVYNVDDRTGSRDPYGGRYACEGMCLDVVGWVSTIRRDAGE